MAATHCAISEISSPDREGIRQAGRSPWRALVAATSIPLSRENPANGSDTLRNQ